MSDTDTPHLIREAPTPYVVDFSDRAELKQRALSLSIDMGNLNGSIEDGGGNMAGLLAELLFIDEFGGERDATYDYDVRTSGVEIDLKTKRRTVAPRPSYEVSIADWNTEQDCDVYYFVSIDVESKRAFYLGGLPPTDYYDIATFHEKGDFDPDNGFTFKADCYNLPIAKLKQPPFIKKQL